MSKETAQQKEKDQTSPQFEGLLEYIKRSRGFDFTGYKRPGLQRRILQRMSMVNINDFVSYQDYLEVHPDEFTQLFNTILINVTGFFRDTPTWEYVAKQIIPRIVAKRNGNGGNGNGANGGAVRILRARAAALRGDQTIW